jgi:hypothetical protein
MNEYGQLVFHNYPEYCIEIKDFGVSNGSRLIAAKVDKSRVNNDRQLWFCDDNSQEIVSKCYMNEFVGKNGEKQLAERNYVMDLPGGDVKQQLQVWIGLKNTNQKFKIIPDPTKTAFRISYEQKDTNFYVDSSSCGKPNDFDPIVLKKEDGIEKIQDLCPGGKEKSSTWFRFVPEYDSSQHEILYADPESFEAQENLETTQDPEHLETSPDPESLEAQENLETTPDPEHLKTSQDPKQKQIGELSSGVKMEKAANVKKGIKLEKEKNNQKSKENNKNSKNNENEETKVPWYKNTKILLAIGGGMTLIVTIIIVVVVMKSKGTKNEAIKTQDSQQYM